MRTHIILPEELVTAVDSVVGKRKRSRFVEEAVREKLRKGALLRALEAAAGAFRAEDHPEWTTSEDVAHGVADLRRQDSQMRDAGAK